MVIRPAERGDSAAIGELCGQLGYAATEGEVAGRLGELMSDGRAAVFVAESGGVVVAVMQVSVRRTIESGEWAEIDGLVVNQETRGTGVGTLLVLRARAWARNRKVERLRVRTNELRARAHGFYERAGFTLSKTQRVYDIDA